MAQGAMTYWEVLEFVKGDESCCLDDAKLEVLLVNVLLEMWTELRDCPEYQYSGTFNLTAEQASYPIDTLMPPDGVARIVSLVLDCDQLKQIGGDLDCPVCDPIPGTPTEYWLWGDDITFNPIPDADVTLDVRGYRQVNCELYEIVDDVKVWNTVDLPTEFHSVYAKVVQGLSYAQAKDFSAASYWLQIGSNETDSLKEAKDQLNRESLIISIGGNSCKDPCCGTPPKMQLLEIVETVEQECCP